MSSFLDKFSKEEMGKVQPQYYDFPQSCADGTTEYGDCSNHGGFAYLQTPTVKNQPAPAPPFVKESGGNVDKTNYTALYSLATLALIGTGVFLLYREFKK